MGRTTWLRSGLVRHAARGPLALAQLGLTTIGVAVGLAGAVGLSRLMASLLFGVEPTDARTLASVVLTIALVAVVACSLPAWRASRLDPNVVLRED